MREDMEEKLKILFLIVAGAFAVFLLLRMVVPAGAHYSHEWNTYPTITLTPTPTTNPCQEVKWNEDENPCVTPTETPTSTPSATPTSQPENRSDGQHSAPDGLGCATHECKAPSQSAPIQPTPTLYPQVGWK